MVYLLAFLMLLAGYYTVSYGVTLYKEEDNRLGGAATVVIALLGTITPIIILFMRQG